MDHLENPRVGELELRGINALLRVSRVLEELVRILVGRRIGRSYKLRSVSVLLFFSRQCRVYLSQGPAQCDGLQEFRMPCWLWGVKVGVGQEEQVH